jgi:hypothetical protein
MLELAGLSRALYAGDDTTDLDGVAALGGRELVVRPVADEDALLRLDSQPFAGKPVDARIGLPQANRAREHDVVEVGRERRLVPYVLDVAGADGDQAAPEASPAQLLQRLDRPFAREQGLARVLAAKVGERAGVRLVDAQRREHRANVLEQRACRPLEVRVVERAQQRARLDTGVLGHAGVHVLMPARRPEDNRVPEVEDHCAHRRSTSQARRTSASVVRALPTASRSQ